MTNLTFLITKRGLQLTANWNVEKFTKHITIHTFTLVHFHEYSHKISV